MVGLSYLRGSRDLFIVGQVGVEVIVVPSVLYGSESCAKSKQKGRVDIFHMEYLRKAVIGNVMGL